MRTQATSGSQVPGIFVQLACVTGVAAACDIARGNAGLLAAIVMRVGSGEHARFAVA